MAHMSEIRTLTDELRQFVADKGSDLFGIAPVTSYEGAGEQMHPRYYIPDAQAALVIGLRVPKAVAAQVERHATHYSLYVPSGIRPGDSRLNLQ